MVVTELTFQCSPDYSFEHIATFKALSSIWGVNKMNERIVLQVLLQLVPSASQLSTIAVTTKNILNPSCHGIEKKGSCQTIKPHEWAT